MSEPRDMDAPVTRREMHEALETWAAVVIDNVIGKMTDKMTSMLAASEQRLTSMIVSVEQRLTAVMGAMSMLEVRLTSAMHDVEARLTSQLAGGTKASEEELTTRVRVVDEQYKDLPARVTTLEAKVFAPPKRKRRASR